MAGLEQFADVTEVKNVYLFIADSVRNRETSDAVTSLGVSGRAISASTYTASSYPSILTGNYPASHHVWSFDDKLSQRPELLTGPESFGLNAETIWTDVSTEKKPPFRIIGATAEDEASINQLSPPFVAVEHHKGGHTPYGYSFAEYTTPDFFEQVRPKLGELSKLYRDSVRTAEERFLRAVENLKRRGLLEQTLVIYTSDHGEALGEKENHAIVGHGDPISPDQVNVPLVFAGAGLPNLELDSPLSGTDVAPTAISALGRSFSGLDGTDCWKGTLKDRLLRSERWVQTELPTGDTFDRYKGTSVWDSEGGIVFQQGSRLARAVSKIKHELVSAPWSYLNREIRRPGRWTALLKGSLAKTLRYGDPGFDEASAISEIEPFHEQSNTDEGALDREHLRNLGYLE